jgi:micrococcal nuclease
MKKYPFKSCYANILMKLNKVDILLIFLVVLSGVWYWFLTSPSNFYDYTSVNVSRVIDGDTFADSEGMKYRLKGINTPETNMWEFEEAKAFLESQNLGISVDAVLVEKDKYGRWLTYVFRDDDNVNEVLLREGLAHLYYYEKDEFYSDLASAEEYARDNQLGIWKHSLNFDCLSLVELDYYDDVDENETLILDNKCGNVLDVVIKDDATHIFEERLSLGLNEFHYHNTFNDGGDSLYVWDEQGLVEFYRYS